MKISADKTNRYRLFIISFCIALFAAVEIFSLFFPKNQQFFGDGKKAEELSDIVYYHENNEPYKASDLKKIRLDNEHKIIGKTNFFANGPNAALLFTTEYTYLRIYINDELMYDSQQYASKQPFGQLPAYACHLLNLPPEVLETTVGLRFELNTSLSNANITIKPPMVGTSENLLIAYQHKYLPKYLLSIIIFTICIIICGLYMLYRKKIKDIQLMRSMALFSITATVWAFSSCELQYIYFKNTYILYMSSYISFMCMPIIVNSYLKALYKNRYDILFDFLSSCSALIFCILILLHIFNISELYLNLYIIHTVLIINISLMLIIILREAYHRKEKLNYILIGIIQLFVISSLELIKSYIFKTDLIYDQFLIGLLIFMLMFLFQAVKVNIEILKKAANAEKFEIIANTDSLTGISNRRSMDLALKNLNEQLNESSEIVIGVFDINNLKYMNDNYGHIEGDRLIVETAKQLRIKLESYGKIYRSGGDEFVFIGKDVKADKLRKIVRSTLEEAKETVNGKRLNFSFAINDYNSSSDNDIYALYKRTDFDMYSYKVKQKDKDKLKSNKGKV